MHTEPSEVAAIDCPFSIPDGATFTYGPHVVGSGDHYKFKFANGYGASVVRFQLDGGFGGSYGADSGRWELAVLGPGGHLDYDTPITDDVIGWLSEDEVSQTLARIAALASDQSVATTDDGATS